MPRPGFWKRKVYVHPVQRRCLSLSLLPLTIGRLAIVVAAFLPLKLLLLAQTPEVDKAIA